MYIFNIGIDSARDNSILFIEKKDSSLCIGLCCGKRANVGRGRPTVDSNGDALVKDVAIRALESWDLAQLVELQVLGGGLGDIDVDNVEVETVGLRDRLDGSAARVSLCRSAESVHIHSQ